MYFFVEICYHKRIFNKYILYFFHISENYDRLSWWLDFLRFWATFYKPILTLGRLFAERHLLSHPRGCCSLWVISALVTGWRRLYWQGIGLLPDVCATVFFVCFFFRFFVGLHCWNWKLKYGKEITFLALNLVWLYLCSR